ncbi:MULTISPECIES: type VI secretion system-associated protein TagF [Methylomicrobium]|uniref:Type VI secretion-associated protein, BMA_A0400 family n=1 Tax=Methylomicrobium album BG8 TaxID=686340 RepID=H8GN47_METAL|nr:MULTISPECIES: type VI secretion system-associated protein TagF [Methylomicrobium]EIC30761.1 type VI secretion-associated protein, BMA_A0400 family [Methylomicrobium album BG8]
MIQPQSAPGFYGKIPSHGDFLSRRLPRQFIEPWDQWLQAGLTASREQLGPAWLDTFLISPIWQFALPAGLCGNDAWAGVMMPSVDRVGRYFPLTLAAKVNNWPLTDLFEPDCSWFEALSQLALFSLDYDFDLDSFDGRLERLHLREFVSVQPIRYGQERLDTASARQAFHFRLDTAADTPRALRQIGSRLGARFLERCSYWRSTALEASETSFLLCDGMPPVDAFVGFLNGVWPNRQWNLSNLSLAGSLPVTDTKVSQPAIEAEASSTGPAAGDPVWEHGEITRGRETRAPLRRSGAKWVTESAGLSVVGMRRKLNEDAILERCEAGMWAVADGMGGHSAGDVASKTAVAALAKISGQDGIDRYQERVEACLQSVNRELLRMAESRGHGQIIGSTIVVLLISGKHFRYLWAGDSRLYRYRQGILEQLTQDHSLSPPIADGGLGASEASAVPVHENVITRAVGADELLELDAGEGEIADRDLFILCSDGLIKELADADIIAYCMAGSPEEIVRNLVREAEMRGGRDNISVVIVSVACEKL